MTPSGGASGCYQIHCGCVFLFGAVSCLNVAGLQQETSLTFLLVHRSQRVGILDYIGHGKDMGGRQSIACAVCGKQFRSFELRFQVRRL